MLLGKTNSKRRHLAFTVTEVAFAVGIASIIAVALATTLQYSVRSINGLNNYVALDRDGRRSLDMLLSDIRGCRAVTTAVPSGQYTNLTSVSFTDKSYGTLTYSFGTNNQLVRSQGGTNTILMTNCTGYFDLYQPGLYENSWNQYTNAQTLGDCKVVLIKWKAVRTMLGALSKSDDKGTPNVLKRHHL